MQVRIARRAAIVATAAATVLSAAVSPVAVAADMKANGGTGTVSSGGLPDTSGGGSALEGSRGGGGATSGAGDDSGDTMNRPARDGAAGGSARDGDDAAADDDAAGGGGDVEKAAESGSDAFDDLAQAADDGELPDVAGFTGGKYVALGDSYTAMGSPLGSANMAMDPAAASCVRSGDGLGPRVAELIGANLVNASCSGALPVHYWESQNGVAPQRDALDEDTKLVTMTMGGNVLIPASMSNPAQCAAAVVGSQETCEKVLRDTGVVDQLVEIWADIKDRAPNAQLLAVGYLQNRLDRGIVPIYNRLVKEAADASGVPYVEPGFGVDLTGYLEGGYGIHPSAEGQKEAASNVVRALMGEDRSGGGGASDRDAGINAQLGRMEDALGVGRLLGGIAGAPGMGAPGGAVAPMIRHFTG